MGRFSELSAAFHDHATSNPNTCVEKGVPRLLGDLPEPTMEAAEERLARARRLLARVEEIAPLRAGEADGELSQDDLLDLDLAWLLLQGEIHRGSLTFNERLELAQMPRAGDEIGSGIFLMFTNDPRPAAERLVNITERLEKVPSYLSALLERLDTPVGRWVEMDVEKIRGLDSLFETIEGWAKKESFVDLERLSRARASARTAMDGYVEQLSTMPTTGNLHIGVEATRELVALQGIELSLEELKALATRFLSDTARQLEELRGRLVKKYELPPDTPASELQKHLARVHAVPVENGNYQVIIDRYEQERERILAFIHERDLFPIPADQDMWIMQTPDFMIPSIPAGAMMPPAAFRTGTARSLVYLTLGEELLDEHTELSIPGMMIHEGIPGHHLQLAMAARHPSVIRRHVVANDHHEGWTTMLEDYMLDIGYMGDLADEARFVGKLDLSRLGARVAIDLFFMTGERDFLDVGVKCDIADPDGFQACENLLRAVTGFVPERARGEVNWYSQERGYPLCYLTGNHLVWQLKRDMLARRPPGEDRLDTDRLFHRTYLEAGNMPVSFLRRVFRQRGLVE